MFPFGIMGGDRCMIENHFSLTILHLDFIVALRFGIHKALIFST